MSVGSDLKSARESKKITLEAISQKTRIPVKYLEALEEDHFDVFPSHTYAKGFIRAYCKIVGLDTQKMTKEFRAQVPETPVKIEPMNAEVEMEKNSPFLGSRPAVIRPIEAGQGSETMEEGEDLPEVRETLRHPSRARRQRVKWLSFYSSIGQMAVGLAFLGALWLGWQKLSPWASKFHWSAVKAAPAATLAPASSPAPAPASLPVAHGQAVADKYQHLILKGLDKSWVLVTLDDGKSSSELHISQGDVRTFRAQRKALGRLRNHGRGGGDHPAGGG
jgi:transcriptional regulator with XRE-family HTH domain